MVKKKIRTTMSAAAYTPLARGALATLGKIALRFATDLTRGA
jgi:hypothetical protein